MPVTAATARVAAGHLQRVDHSCGWHTSLSLYIYIHAVPVQGGLRFGLPDSFVGAACVSGCQQDAHLEAPGSPTDRSGRLPGAKSGRRSRGRSGPTCLLGKPFPDDKPDQTSRVQVVSMRLPSVSGVLQLRPVRISLRLEP